MPSGCVLTLLIFLPVKSSNLFRHIVRTLGARWTVNLLQAATILLHLETEHRAFVYALSCPKKARHPFTSPTPLRCFKAAQMHKAILKYLCLIIAHLTYAKRWLMLEYAQHLHAGSNIVNNGLTGCI